MTRSPVLYGAIAAVVATVGVASWVAWGNTPTPAVPNQQGVTQTQWGPLDDADRDLLARVALAGLWEHPVGHDMGQRATQPKAREVGEKISQEHAQLSEINEDTAERLGVALPVQPLPDQQGWIKQVAAAQGPDIGKTAVKLLRASHGSILPQIWTVRVDTRNSLIRSLAEQAAAFVQRHINYLESTGLVDYDQLPRAEPTAEGHAVVTKAGTYEIVPDGLPTIAIFVLLAGIAAVIVCLVLLRRRAQPQASFRIPVHPLDRRSADEQTLSVDHHRRDGRTGDAAQPQPGAGFPHDPAGGQYPQPPRR